jgi:glyoxylase-like metal-dependent hydrolase (beta-lactamase superfamily II)
MVSPKPKQVRLRVYQAGFGDCLLLTVTYKGALGDGRSERHMLIDCGMKVQRKGGPTMAQLAERIAEHCGGRLDVVVATHRHQDHVRGFGDAAARRTLDALTPRLVVRPWTDIPESERADPAFGLDEASQGFISMLEGVHAQAAYVDQHFALNEGSVARRAKELVALGIKNAAAVATLEEWARTGRPAWVRAGDEIDLSDVMSGVRARVLGPPTLDQVPSLTRYATSSGEYWLRLASAGELGPMIRPDAPTPEAAALATLAEPGGAGAARWLLGQLGDQERLQALSIAEGFDNVLNNTSVILLVTVGRRSMLFAGDAQAENWSFTLDQAYGEGGRPLDEDLRSELAGAELYKVGHHGSRNATPRRLYELWRPRRDGNGTPLTSVLTTLSGVYDESAEGAVPKEDLVNGLREVGPVFSTEDLAEDVWWFDVSAPATGGKGYRYSAGPAIG